MERKQLRLPEYDYSQTGVYFLTLCAKGKAPLFGKVCVGGGVLDAPYVELSDMGVVVQDRLEEMDRHYEHLSMKKHIIMPNHVHLLVEVCGPSRTPAPTQGDGNGPSRTPAPTQGDGNGPSGTPAPTQGDGNGPSGTPAPTKANQAIPAYVSTLKRLTNRTCDRELWHRGYYDHVIRNEADFLRIWTYIDANPAKWADDEYFVR